MQTDSSFPRTCEQALNRFRQAEILPEYFGRGFCNLLSNLKTGEQVRFYSAIAAREYDWYLRTV